MNELKSFGVQPIEAFGGEEFARCTFINSTGEGQIDVRCRDDATEDELKSVSGVQSLAIPGGRRALQVCEEVLITYDVDAAAAIDQRTVNQPRHVQDLVDMPSVLDDPVDGQATLWHVLHAGAPSASQAENAPLVRPLLSAWVVENAAPRVARRCTFVARRHFRGLWRARRRSQNRE